MEVPARAKETSTPSGPLSRQISSATLAAARAVVEAYRSRASR